MPSTRARPYRGTGGIATEPDASRRVGRQRDDLLDQDERGHRDLVERGTEQRVCGAALNNC
ncbi:MAG: hypothetical protein ACRDRH_19315 [Pseudonocardia sp.]